MDQLQRLTCLSALIIVSFLAAPVFAQEITIGSDGIVRCKDVPDGTSQVIGLDTYEVAHSATKVRERFLYGQDVTKLCVSNITDMSGLFGRIHFENCPSTERYF